MICLATPILDPNPQESEQRERSGALFIQKQSMKLEARFLFRISSRKKKTWMMQVFLNLLPIFRAPQMLLVDEVLGLLLTRILGEEEQAILLFPLVSLYVYLYTHIAMHASIHTHIHR